MLFGWLADAVVVLHTGFVLFVLVGGLLVLKWPGVMWLHLPAAAWGVFVEWSGWRCPLTPLEQWLREQGGARASQEDFVAHYLLPLLYPSVLTRNLQLVLGGIVLLVNAVIYAWVWRRKEGQSAS